MDVQKTAIPEVLVIHPKVFGDDRGFFFESFNERVFQRQTGVEQRFVQDNHSLSQRGVLRGLHYQLPDQQGKLVRVMAGSVFDVAVDIRASSPTFGAWVGEVLDASSHKQLWVPGGFAHGFLVLSERAEVLYKTTDYYAPENEHCISWNDTSLDIEWPLAGNEPLLSEKDRAGVPLEEAVVFP